MITDYFIKGLLLGFYIAAPFGVISLIYVKRTVQNGKLSGVVSALAVVISETLYATVVIFGLSPISTFLISWKNVIKCFGALFMIYVGIRAFFVDPNKEKYVSKKQKLIVDFVSMFGLSSLNPILIIGFLTIFATFDAGIFKNNYQAFVMLSGFAMASLLYCFCTISIAYILSKKFHIKDKEMVKILNQMSGVLIIIFTITIFAFSILKQ